MNLSHIPTPETDLFYSSFADGIATPSQSEWLYRMQDIERRLTVAREALKFAFDAVTSVTVKSRAEGEILQSAARVAKETLAFTAPEL